MKRKKTLLLFLLIGVGELHAQQSPLTTGGEATGTGGSSSYSVGQVVYTSVTDGDIDITQGVQQPFEVTTVITGGFDDASINLELSAYPNPTTNSLTLEVDNASDLNYQLYDLQGNLVLNETVMSNVTLINLGGQPTAVYFLKVMKSDQEVKTF